MDTVTKWTPQQVESARAIVARLQEVQRARKLSDRQLVDEYPDLGSAKTWRQRLVGSEWAGLNPERTLVRLRRVETILDGGVPDTVFYGELPFAREFTTRLMLLERSTTDRRILVTLAPNGCGKTTAARWAVAQRRSARAYCRLRPAWRNKELHIANGIARALGSDDDTSNAAEAEGRLIALLSGQARTLILDQAHEGGPALMHLLRALVDETPSRFVYLGYDTAFRRVQTANSDAMIEAQAFLGRCLKPIFDGYKRGTSPLDVRAYLQLAAGLSASAAGSLAARVTPVLQRTTNLRLLADAIEVAQLVAPDGEAEPDVIVTQVYAMAGLDPAQARNDREEEDAA